MQNILILNGGGAHGESQGKLNLAFCEIMADELQKLGKSVETTHIAQGYEVAAEVQKWQAADCVILQTPGWWMGEPWFVKKYFDTAISSPDAVGVLFKDDGRTRSDPTKRYGTGGLCAGKAMMLSTTWNAPRYAFDIPGEFFDARGVDEIFTHIYKIFQFLGFSHFLPSFMANDVHKAPNFKAWETDLRAHIREYF